MLHRPADTCLTDLQAWTAAFRDRPLRSPPEDAVHGGRQSGTIGLAFLSGYQAALRALVSDLPRTALVALAATEDGGAHPKAIETRVEGGRLVGKKNYITLGTHAERLLVVARRSPLARELVVVEIDAHQSGVKLTPLPNTPFVPDVPHAELLLDVEIAGAEIRDGDGYSQYLKPFRTIEDLHVLLALLAHGAEVARTSGAEHILRERIAAAVAALLGLAGRPPLSPALHIALGGLMPEARRILEALGDHLRVSSDERADRWTRDLPVLGVAQRVRQKRLERAWEAFA